MTSRRWPLFALLLLLAVHGAVNVARFTRVPYPAKTFHDYDVKLVKTPMVLRGHAWASDLPVVDLVPPDWPGLGPVDLLKGTARNDGRINTYQTAVPLWFLVSAAWPAAVGITPLTVRMGPLLVLALYALLMFDIGRSLAGRRAGFVVGAAATLVPVAYQGAWVGLPALGNMCGVALAIALLLRSDGLARWRWAPLVGAACALSTRWGESAGEGVESAAALVGPILITGGVALARLLKRRPAGVVGAALAGTVFVPLLHHEWVLRHLMKYVYSEAGVQEVSAVGLPEIDPLALIAENAWAYPEALYYSLLTPVVVALVAAALPFFLRLCALRTGWRAAVVASSPMTAWLVLTLSEKSNDYYGAPMVPGLCVILGVGLLAVPRIGRWLAAGGLAALAASWLAVAHNDLPGVRERICTPPLDALIAAHAEHCQRFETFPQMEHWFRRWRGDPNTHIATRARLAQWILEGRGRQVFDALPTRSLVLIVAPLREETDVVMLLGQALRPDVLLQWIPRPAGPQGVAARLLADHDHIFALTFPKEPDRVESRPQELPQWLSAVQHLAETGDVSMSQVRPR